MKHGIENIVLVKNLMYKGCENHYGCIRCGEIYPAHCFNKEQMAERECDLKRIEEWRTYKTW